MDLPPSYWHFKAGIFDKYKSRMAFLQAKKFISGMSHFGDKIFIMTEQVPIVYARHVALVIYKAVMKPLAILYFVVSCYRPSFSFCY